MADWIALIVVVILMFLGPYAIAQLRGRISHSAPQRLYAPHLVFLCTVRFAPMLSKGVPSSSVTILAFLEAFVIWVVAVSVSEKFLPRGLHRGA